MDPLVVGTLLVVFAALAAVGVPIAFALGMSATAALLFAVAPVPAVTTVAQRIATGIDSFTLLAIPLFILSGQIMNRGGSATRLVDLGRALVGRLPGGLMWVNVVACLLFGAISGSAVAAAAAIGGFMIPALEREGWGRDRAAAVNLTSATTGLLIPPSNILIVYSLASGGVSIAALFVAGYVPGLLVGLAIGAVAAWGAFRERRKEAPAQRTRSDVRLRTAFVRAIPSLLLIVIIMGGIVGGVFTATEAAAIAVVYALVLALAIHREIGARDLYQITLDAAATTGVVMLLVGASMALSWVLAWERVPQAISSALLDSVDSPLAILLVMNVVLLAVGTFMDITPAVLVFTPIFLPVATGIGLDPVHFGIIMVLNLCIGLCTPPVGTVLFVGLGVGETTIERILPKLVPLWLAMIVALVLITAFPELTLWLPRLLNL